MVLYFSKNFYVASKKGSERFKKLSISFYIVVAYRVTVSVIKGGSLCFYSMILLL